MSRIRSVHPGLFTDPEFLQVGMAARMLLIGLWTEADDRGVFEWKPLALKIKLFPVDSVDVDALLEELIGAERIRKVEHQGKAYGICRKFCKYQRPKNPSEGHPFSPEWASFVHLLPQDPRFKSIELPQEGGSPTPALPQEGVKPSADGEERRVEKKKEVEALPRPPAKRGTRIPEDFAPSAAGVAFCTERGLSLETTSAKFRDHWTAETGQKAAKADWDAAWRTWCRNEVTFARNKPSPPAHRGAYVAPGPDNDTRRLEGFARMIKAKVSPGQYFSNADRFKLIKAGLVTMEDCERAGCAA